MKKEEFCAALSDINENYVKEARTEHKAEKPGRLRWAAMAAACFAVVAIAGIGMLQSGLLGKKTDIAALDNGDKITFVKSKAVSSSIDIDGTITERQLTDKETAALFPDLPVTAQALFMNGGTDAGSSQELIGFEGNIENMKMIISASDVHLLDTVIAGTEESSEVNGISITAGYFVTDPNSKGEQNAIYYAAFEIGSCRVYLENAGVMDESEKIKARLAEAVEKLTGNGELDLTTVEVN